MRNIKIVLLELLLIVIPFSDHVVFEIIKIIIFLSSFSMEPRVNGAERSRNWYNFFQLSYMCVQIPS